MAQHYNNPGLPAGLYSGGGQRVDTRPIANMLYQEQRYQQARQQKEAEDLDNEMKSNIGKIKESDREEYVNSFQDYANSTKNVMFNEKLKRDKQEYQKAQVVRGKAYAKMADLASKSIGVRDMLDVLNKDYSINADKYADDFQTKVKLAHNLPTSQLSAVDSGQKDENGKPIIWDLTNPETYKDQHSYFDFGTLVKDAYGSTHGTGQYKLTPLDNKGIDFMQADMKYGASPMAISNTLMNKFAGSKQAAKAARQFGAAITPQMWEDTVTAYNNIPLQKWKDMGMEKPEDLSELHFPGNDAEKAAHFLSMQHFLTSKVEMDVPKKIEKSANKIALEQSNRKEIVGMEYQNALKVKAAAEGGKVEGNDIIDTLYKDALTNKPNPYYPKSGGQIDLYPAKVDAQLKEALAFKNADGHTVYPNEVKFSKDGKYIYPIVYQYDKDGKVVKNEKTGKISVKTGEPVLTDVLRARMGKTLFGVKENAKIMSQNKNKEVDMSDTDPGDWTKEGKYWKYKDGGLYDDNGKRVK